MSAWRSVSRSCRACCSAARSLVAHHSPLEIGNTNPATPQPLVSQSVLRSSVLLNFIPGDRLTLRANFGGAYRVTAFDPATSVTLDQTIVYEVTPVPEPSAAIGLGAGIAMLAALPATR